MKKIILASVLGILGAFSVGCGGNACESAADTITAKVEECGGKVQTSDSSGESVECTDALGKKAECQAACFEAAPCECVVVDQEKPCEDTKFVECLTDCG